MELTLGLCTSCVKGCIFIIFGMKNDKITTYT
jgi:hypothetical protein